MGATRKIESWGRIKTSKGETLETHWGGDPFPKSEGAILAHGLGRSYGDSCINSQGATLLTRGLRLLEDFEPQSGRLTCGSGTSLAEIIETFLPKGWFPPVVPGTKFVTVGGAIANDIHGKNHHGAGSWCHHVESLKLRRSDREEEQTVTRNHPLWETTCGGLGLSGVITSATLRLARVKSGWVKGENIAFGRLEEFWDVEAESAGWEHSVAWVDTVAGGKSAGRGIFMRGNMGGDPPEESRRWEGGGEPKWSVPITPPICPLNKLSVTAFNTLFGWKNGKKQGSFPNESFFFPLDAVGNWNRLYGKKGFHQYQCVIPKENRLAAEALIQTLSKSGEGSFLAVMKTFGEKPSEGLISFPKEGFTLALDVPEKGERTERLFRELDTIVRSAAGRIYPAKDSRMTKEDFQRQYPEWAKVEESRDPKINSDFWRRVTQP